MKRTADGEALTSVMLEVFRLNGDLLAEGNRLTAPVGQTSARWQVLGALESPQTVSAIARDRGLARQSVQRTADLLEEDGLVEYVDNPAHRRAKLLKLTRHGRAVLDEITDAQVRWVNDLAESLGASSRQFAQAHTVLRRLRTELERREKGARHVAAS